MKEITYKIGCFDILYHNNPNELLYLLKKDSNIHTIVVYKYDYKPPKNHKRYNIIFIKKHSIYTDENGKKHIEYKGIKNIVKILET